MALLFSAVFSTHHRFAEETQKQRGRCSHLPLHVPSCVCVNVMGDRSYLKVKSPSNVGKGETRTRRLFGLSKRVSLSIFQILANLLSVKRSPTIKLVQKQGCIYLKDVTLQPLKPVEQLTAASSYEN